MWGVKRRELFPVDTQPLGALERNEVNFLSGVLQKEGKTQQSKDKKQKEKHKRKTANKPLQVVRGMNRFCGVHFSQHF